MTRVLSELLGAPEPMFRLNLAQLERAAGRPNTDIRLSSELNRLVQTKLHGLGLDPHDTTGPELYAMLGERLKADEARFRTAICNQASAAGDPIAHVAAALMSVITPKSCFALKAAIAKKLLRSLVPKRTMKALGYRSLDSMLKHEPVACLYAAAWLVESEQWLKRLVGAYQQLSAADFEDRALAIEHPTAGRWQALSDSVVATRKHHVLGFKELGSVVLLPLPLKQPPLATLTTAVLTLHAVNDIRVSSTFLKLHQVKPDFGVMVQRVVLGEPVVATRLLERAVPWQIIQRYYARFAGSLRTDIFEPHIQPEDLCWHSVEKVLASIEPTLEFWRSTAHLALLHKRQPVSFNLTDALLSHCNQLPFENRLVQYFRRSLLAELMLRYMNHDRLEQTVLQQLQNELVAEPALL